MNQATSRSITPSSLSPQPEIDRVGTPGFSQVSRQVVIIDPGVADYQSLLCGISPDSKVHILDPNRDGIEQITELLSHETSSLHIISHGAAGTLHLGVTPASPATTSTTIGSNCNNGNEG